MASMDIDSPATPSMAITPVLAEDNDETPISTEQPNKRRRKKSIVWEHFTIETVGAGCMRACCKQCKKSFAYITGSKLAGTSHLKRHIALGICPVSRQKNEASQLLSGVKSEPPPKRRYRSSPVLGSVPFNQDRCNQDVAKMIIQHEYPLHIVEHPAFIDFVRTLQPQYNMVSFNTIQGEIVALYLREKQGLLNLISELPGRVSISLDLRTSNLNVGYAFLTGYFIDNDWKLHRRILNVVMLPFPESEYAFNQAVVSCISDWHLESRLFTLTLDQSVANDNIIGNLRGLLSVKNQLMFNGQLVKGNCYARVLSRLAQDALGAMDEVVKRIRESVKYVKTSDSHDEKFAELRLRLQVPSTRDLIIDDQTKWDTTYHMLVAACELKEVFACLDTTDPVYKINPSMDDWKQVEILCTYLKLLYDAASILTGPMYPPANAFYHEVSKIQLELTHAAMSQDLFVSNLARPLKEKFDQYWRDCFLVLAIAIVMDPRFKMKLVEFSFSRIFGEDAGMWIKIVDDGIHELFLDYLAPNLSVPTTYMDSGNTNSSQSDIFQDAHHQEATFQELQAMHNADVAAHELDSQGATIQELQPEGEPKEDLLQDLSSQVMNHPEVDQHEISAQVAPLQDTQTQEPLQEDSQEVAKHVDSQSVAAQEVNGQVEATQEMDSQEATEEINSRTELHEMDSQEVSVKEMDSQEATAEQMVIQDVTMEEMQNTVEVPVPEKCIEEGSVEENNKEEVSPVEMLTEKRNPSEVIQAQGTNDEMGQEKVTPEIQHQDKPTQDVHAEENMTVETHSQEEPNSDMPAQEKSIQEGDTGELIPAEEQTEKLKPADIEEMEPAKEQTGELKPAEEPTEDLKPADIEDMKPAKEPTGESKPAEEQTEDLEPAGEQTGELKPAEELTGELKPAEEHTGELKPAEEHTEDLKPAEERSEELKPAEERSEELKPAEERSEEIKPAEERSEELKPAEERSEELKTAEESDLVKPADEQTELSKPGDEHIEEIKSAEEQTMEMKSSELPGEEMQPAEAQDAVMQPLEGQSQEIETGEEMQEMQNEEEPIQEIPHVEETQEMHPPEGETQEMPSSEGQTQEMPSSEGQTQEIHPSDAQTQGMHPPVAQTQETCEMRLLEEQSQEMQPLERDFDQFHSQEEAQSHEMQLDEAQAHHMQLQDGDNHEDMHFQGVQYQDQDHQATHNQEMQAQEMEYQALSHEMQTQDLPLLSIGDGLQDFEVYISEIANSQHWKSELDQYLEESLLPRVQDFDVLGWWKLNKLKYPTLSKMAADILSIPVSTAAPESVFDIRSRKVDSYQSSLQPVTLEALVCAKDWLQSGSSSAAAAATPGLDMSNALVRMEY